MRVLEFEVNRLITNLNCCKNNQSEELHPENFAKISPLNWVVLMVSREEYIGPIWINNSFAAYNTSAYNTSVYHDKHLCIGYFYSKKQNKVKLFS